MNKAEIIVECDEEIFSSLKPEVDTSISRAKLYQSSGLLKLEIYTEDVSDLRAAVNSWLRLIRMCLEIEEVLGNE